MKRLKPVFKCPLLIGEGWGEVIFLFFLTFSSFAQKLSLQDCIDYAEKHHPDIQNLQMTKESERIELQRIKNQWLPTLNLSFNQAGNLGRTIDPFSNDVVTRAITFNSLGVSGGFTVYAGNRQKLQEAKQELAISIANYRYVNAKRTKQLEIVRIYFAILLDKIAIELKKQQVQEIENQLLRLKELTKEGITSALQQNEQLVLLANENIQLKELETILMVDKNTLETLIFWQNKTIIDIKDNLETMILPQKLTIEAAVLQRNTQILEQNLEIKAIEVDKKIQLSAFKPTIQFNLNTSTSYSSAAPSEYTFFRQLNSNFGQYIGVGLNYPIFPRNQQKIIFEKNRILTLQQTEIKDKIKFELEQQLNLIALEYASAMLQIEEMKVVVKHFKLIYEAALEKYSEGVLTTIELSQWQHKYYESQFNLTKKQLSARLLKKLVDTYSE